MDSGWERLRMDVLAAPDLQARLFPLVDESTFVDALVGIAGELGYAVTAEEIILRLREATSWQAGGIF